MMTLAQTVPGEPARAVHRRRLFDVLETSKPGDRASRVVDAVLVVLIVASVVAIVLESVDGLALRYGPIFLGLQIVSVLIFSVEYLLRVWCAPEHDNPKFRPAVIGRVRYMLTPMALVDLVAILPFYLGVFFTLDLRFLRMLRLLRLLKLTRYAPVLAILVAIIKAEMSSVGVALSFLGLVLVFAATGIYYFEHEAQPTAFANIPAAMWWAVATITTVGYGDVTPITPAGKVFGAFVSIAGVGMIAIPAGLMASRLTDELRLRRENYHAMVDRALQDGVITRNEQRAMERQRHNLGLSEEDASAITRQAWREHIPPESCPHCGRPLGD